MMTISRDESRSFSRNMAPSFCLPKTVTAIESPMDIRCHQLLENYVELRSCDILWTFAKNPMQTMQATWHVWSKIRSMKRHQNCMLKFLERVFYIFVLHSHRHVAASPDSSTSVGRRMLNVEMPLLYLRMNSDNYIMSEYIEYCFVFPDISLRSCSCWPLFIGLKHKGTIGCACSVQMLIFLVMMDRV